jgi:hypothetical protein
MATPFPASPLLPTPAVPLAERAEARRRQGPLHAAYAHYVRLHRQHRATLASDPQYQPLACADGGAATVRLAPPPRK